MNSNLTTGLSLDHVEFDQPSRTRAFIAIILHPRTAVRGFASAQGGGVLSGIRMDADRMLDVLDVTKDRTTRGTFLI